MICEYCGLGPDLHPNGECERMIPSDPKCHVTALEGVMLAHGWRYSEVPGVGWVRTGPPMTMEES